MFDVNVSKLLLRIFIGFLNYLLFCNKLYLRVRLGRFLYINYVHIVATYPNYQTDL